LKIIIEQTQEVGWLIVNRTPCSGESRISEADLKSSDQEVTVLIDDIEVMNHPQGFARNGSPVLVGMEIVNGLLGFGKHACYCSSLLDEFVIVNTPPDWEATKSRFPRLPRLPLGQLPCKMIEGGPKVVDYISSPSDHINRDDPERNRPSSPLSLCIRESTYSLFGTVGKGFHIQEVLFGPFGLY
jgi:hypothetical protein